jgi:REP element-mobilizing transposase RayT
MARPLRIEFPGAVYHVTSRGNAKQTIFLEKGDNHKFLKVLSTVVERFNWSCHAYCLMNNHYHLIVETPEGNLSRGMRQLNGVYTQVFNRRHGRVGHLFQGRYKAILVERDAYLLSLCRYIILNPVRAGFVKRPDQWRWSSYKPTIGETKGPLFLRTGWILSQFDDDKREAVKKYRKYVLDGINAESPWKALAGQIILGTKNFLEKFDGLLRDREILNEVPKVQRYAARPALSKIFEEGRIEDRKDKAEKIYDAYCHYGYTQREIGEYLAVHYSTIGRSIKWIEGLDKEK